MVFRGARGQRPSRDCGTPRFAFQLKPHHKSVSVYGKSGVWESEELTTEPRLFSQVTYFTKNNAVVITEVLLAETMQLCFLHCCCKNDAVMIIALFVTHKPLQLS